MGEAGVSPVRWPERLQKNLAFWRSPNSLCREKTESCQSRGFSFVFTKLTLPTFREMELDTAVERFSQKPKDSGMRENSGAGQNHGTRLFLQQSPMNELARTRHLSAG